MEELKRWRLILGEDKESEFDFDLNQDEQQKDKLLQQIYHPKSQNQKQKSQSKKDIKNWLEGIRTHFPPNIVSIMQRDALERKDMKAVSYTHLDVYKRQVLWGSIMGQFLLVPQVVMLFPMLSTTFDWEKQN